MFAAPNMSQNSNPMGNPMGSSGGGKGGAAGGMPATGGGKGGGVSQRPMGAPDMQGNYNPNIPAGSQSLMPNSSPYAQPAGQITRAQLGQQQTRANMPYMPQMPQQQQYQPAPSYMPQQPNIADRLYQNTQQGGMSGGLSRFLQAAGNKFAQQPQASGLGGSFQRAYSPMAESNRTQGILSRFR